MKNHAAAGTRLKLILAAERLFAERGLAAVSLRQINQAAGQRNASALHYHFGSRDGLIAAVFAYRTGAVDRRRNALIDAVVAEGRERDMGALVETFVIPFAEELERRPEGSFYARFIAQMDSDPTLNMNDLVRGKYDSGVRRVGRLAIQVREDLPRPIMIQRLRMVRHQVNHVMAEAEGFLQYRPEAITETGLRALVANLIDVATGGLLAPMSEECEGLFRGSAAIADTE